MGEAEALSILRRLVEQPNAGLAQDEFGLYCVFCAHFSAGDVKEDPMRPGTFTLQVPVIEHESSCPVLMGRALLGIADR